MVGDNLELFHRYFCYICCSSLCSPYTLGRGNVCELLIIANCEFFPDSQSLEHKKLLLPGTTCTGCAAIAIIGNAISLFSLKRKPFTTHLKPVLRYCISWYSIGSAHTSIPHNNNNSYFFLSLSCIYPHVPLLSHCIHIL